MAHITNAKIVILWDHELRIAAQKLEKLNKKDHTAEEISEALKACFAAIYSPELASGCPVTVMSAHETLQPS